MSWAENLRFLWSSYSFSWPSGLTPQAFLDTLHSLGLADIVDIVVVSVLIYLGLRALTQRRVARVAQGIGLLGLLYLIAVQSGMVLTVSIFRRFFTVILMAMVVIFQEELRRFFERITLWPLRTRDPGSVRDIVEPLAEVAMTCALAKIGALIVVKGRDPLDRHLTGGLRLGGHLSSPLLDSLFDPHSDGHDGAVVIEGNRVTHFGVHLPLSPHTEATNGRGTRHAAALGLSEVSDALCIVVSEQKGTISLAMNGQLTTLSNSRKGLESRIRSFLDDKSPNKDRRGWVRTITQHAILKLLAGVFGCGLWLVFVQGFKPMQQTFTVPVHAHHLNDALRLRHVEPAGVTVTLAGLKRDFVQLKAAPLRVFLDLEEVPEGTHEIPITVDDVDAPDPLRVVGVSPAAIVIDVAHAPAATGGSRDNARSSHRFWLHFQ